MPKAKKTKSKQHSRLSFLRGKSKLKPMLFLLLIATAGTFVLFYASAAEDRIYEACYQDTSPDSSHKVCNARLAYLIPDPNYKDPQGNIHGDVILSTTWRAQEALKSDRWKNYGVRFRAPNYQAPGSVPIKRLYNPNIYKHMWLINPTEVSNAKAFGAYEEAGGNGEFYVWQSQVAGTIPVFRLDRADTQSYFYTTGDYNTVKTTYAAAGWSTPVVAFYAYPASYIPPAYVAPTTTDNSSKPCREQNLQQGSSGECVKFMKGLLNYIYEGSLSVDTNFDAKTANIMTIYAADKGITTYKGVITASVWDHIVRTFEATQKSRNAEIASNAEQQANTISSSAPTGGAGSGYAPCPTNLAEIAEAQKRSSSYSDLDPTCRGNLFKFMFLAAKAEFEQTATTSITSNSNSDDVTNEQKQTLANIAAAYREAYRIAQKGEVEGDNAISPAWPEVIYSYKVEQTTGIAPRYSVGDIILSKGSKTNVGNKKLGYCKIDLYYAKVYPTPLYWTYPKTACRYDSSAFTFGSGAAQAKNLGMKASTISNLLRAKASDRAIRLSLP